MGFSLLAEALLAAHLQHASWTGLLPKFGYSRIPDRDPRATAVFWGFGLSF